MEDYGHQSHLSGPSWQVSQEHREHWGITPKSHVVQMGRTRSQGARGAPK